MKRVKVNFPFTLLPKGDLIGVECWCVWCGRDHIKLVERKHAESLAAWNRRRRLIIICDDCTGGAQ